MNDLALAATKQGPEQQQIRYRANGRFTEAAKHFTAAVTAFTAKLPKELAKDAKELPKELDWAACTARPGRDGTRLGKVKEARATAEPFTKDPMLAKSKYPKLGLYYHGFAAFLSRTISSPAAPSTSSPRSRIP